MMKKTFEKLKTIWKSDRMQELFRFCIVGVLSFIVDYGVMIALTEFFRIPVLISSGISFTLSVIFNYVLCVFWVFDGANRKDKFTIIVFVGSSVIGLGLNELFMWLFVNILGIYYMIAKIFATVLVMIWNYVAKRKAVYLRKD